MDSNRALQDKPKPGRPHILGPRDERKIVRLIVSGKAQTAVQVQSELRTGENLDVSTNTIRRALKRNGLASCAKRKKPLLRKKHRQNRLKFAKKYRKWAVEDWSKVVWSDESKFMLFGSDGRQYCWKKRGEPLRD